MIMERRLADRAHSSSATSCALSRELSATFERVVAVSQREKQGARHRNTAECESRDRTRHAASRQPHGRRQETPARTYPESGQSTLEAALGLFIAQTDL